MNYSVLRGASEALHKIGADALIGRQYKGVGAIIMGHSVVQDRADLVDPGIQISRGFLERIIKYYIENDIDIISLDAAIERLSTGNTKQFVSFTFDDGYRNNLTVALPLFRKYNKPLTIYVTTAFLERRIDHWLGALREIIRGHDQDRLGLGGKVFRTSTSKHKTVAFRHILRCIEKGEIDVGEIHQLARHKNISAQQVLDADALNSAELQELSAEPLVEIGGHTDSHPHLAQLSLDAARAEILANASCLADITNSAVRHFAYPYGDVKSCGAREFALCKELGFRSATTTRLGGLFPAHLEHNTSLPRIRLNGACESIGFMECQRNGAIAAIQTRFGDPVVIA
ncbi:putative Polysaccharide deacetylase [Methylocella tundrae]|uniref:Chitooligosaccharide deacetylase n=1 Tax=Methylocella tundrae TaxID=227605 RepID=A0A8B6M0Q6_METTU|nr:polysaccharide deacetylase family protein [Methylocella tundrae]VTZ20898.1 putative Peptidoglycan/xylan/chitin deacetylase (PgdA/CDA1 family) [Methylocella tundrae]VTZ48398.1 putative Polysaccharide deacetylase [Methylocella tundrae]